MRCRNIDNKLREYARCGCHTCQRLYHELRRNIERSRYEEYDYRPAIPYCPPELTMMRNAVLATAVDFVKEKPVEEPKNLAVKMLVDKLKVEQAQLKAQQTNIDYHTKQRKEFNDKKTATNKNIKELSDALKKLGHKEIPNA